MVYLSCILTAIGISHLSLFVCLFWVQSSSSKFSTQSTLSLWVSFSLFLNVISKPCYFHSCHPANLVCEIESHSPMLPRVRTWPLRNKGKKEGLWTWNNSPTLNCKTLLPQHDTELLPPLICRKWLELETMSLTHSSQPLKLAQHAVSGQSGREHSLNRRINQGKAESCLFLSQSAITKQWGVNSSAPPHVQKCGPWSLTPILMWYFKLSQSLHSHGQLSGAAVIAHFSHLTGLLSWTKCTGGNPTIESATLLLSLYWFIWDLSNWQVSLLLHTFDSSVVLCQLCTRKCGACTFVQH